MKSNNGEQISSVLLLQLKCIHTLNISAGFQGVSMQIQVLILEEDNFCILIVLLLFSENFTICIFKKCCYM